MLILVIFFISATFFLIVFSILTSKINKSIYIYLIKKKLATQGFTAVSITTIDQPEFLRQNDMPSALLLNYGTSPTMLIYKQVLFEDNKKNQAVCIAVIKKFMFLLVGIKYYFNPQ